jgi:site-specific DNA-methyltransferase (adenine-specific)
VQDLGFDPALRSAGFFVYCSRKRNDMLTITNEDNMALMARYPDKYFDLAIVDPPYGINADVKNSTDKKQSKKSASKSKKYGEQKWDADLPTKEYFIELFRVSKEQIIWGVNYYPFDFLAGGRIYWDKCVTMPTYSDGELAYCSLLNSIKSVQIAWHGMIQHDMKNKEHRIHPTQKPVALYKWLLHNYAKEGDKILDTHLGSGSIAIACHDYGFDLTACELDKEYFDAAMKRIHNHTAQGSLF